MVSLFGSSTEIISLKLYSHQQAKEIRFIVILLENFSSENYLFDINLER